MLWWVLACFGVSTLLAFVAPIVLTKGHWHVRRPRLGLSLWFGAFFTGLGFTALGLILSASAAVSTPPEETGLESLALSLLAWIGLLALGAVTALIYTANEPLVEIQKSTVSHLESASYSRTQHRDYELILFHADELLACAVPLKRATVFVSSGLREALTDAELDAVIAHEHAHLTQRHGLALRIAHVNSVALGAFRAGRELRRASLLLVELAADDAAAKATSSAALAGALTTMGTELGDAGMLARAHRLQMQAAVA